MPPRRAFLPRQCLRKAATLSVAGGFLLSGGGLVCSSFIGGSSGFAFIAAALADDGNDGHHARPPAHEHPGPEHPPAGGAHSGDRPHGSGHSGKRDGKNNALSRGEGLQLSRQTSLSYDANRNMMKLHVHLGERGEGHPGPHVSHSGPPQIHTNAMIASAGGRAVETQARAQTDTYIRTITDAVQGRSLETLDKSIKPVAARYQNSVFERPPEATTIMLKSKLPIGSLSYVQNEVLAVGADQASIERAEALGFKAEPIMASEASDHTIVRFTVPSGLDAARGEELLSRELPGQRFELNKVYRLYRASARAEPVTLDKSLPATAPGNAPTCAANRCFAREVIGWKDTLAPCAKNLKIGVIDTGIDLSHPAFEGRHIQRFDFAPEGRQPAPNWHGTAVLALLAGGAQTSTPGLVPDAEFYSASIFYSDERGDMAADTVSLLRALDQMQTDGVKIINMSFAGPRDSLVAEAIERMSEAGVVFVAAAGNEGPTADPAYPAAYPQVIAVTAVTKDLRNYRYANRGNHIDVSAPGVDVWTAAPGGGAGFNTGTSFAAPYVTAVLAVEPPETLKQGKADLLDNLAVMDLGQEGRDPIYGRGLLLAPSECTPPEEAPETVASAAE